MAINRTFNSKTVSLLSTTTNSNGKSSTTKRSFSNIKQSATDEDIYAVANAIKSLISTHVDEVRINETSELNEA